MHCGSISKITVGLFRLQDNGSLSHTERRMYNSDIMIMLRKRSVLFRNTKRATEVSQLDAVRIINFTHTHTHTQRERVREREIHSVAYKSVYTSAIDAAHISLIPRGSFSSVLLTNQHHARIAPTDA